MSGGGINGWLGWLTTKLAMASIYVLIATVASVVVIGIVDFSFNFGPSHVAQSAVLCLLGVFGLTLTLAIVCGVLWLLTSAAALIRRGFDSGSESRKKE